MNTGNNVYFYAKLAESFSFGKVLCANYKVKVCSMTLDAVSNRLNCVIGGEISKSDSRMLAEIESFLFLCCPTLPWKCKNKIQQNNVL